MIGKIFESQKRRETTHPYMWAILYLLIGYMFQSCLQILVKGNPTNIFQMITGRGLFIMIGNLFQKMAREKHETLNQTNNKEMGFYVIGNTNLLKSIVFQSLCNGGCVYFLFYCFTQISLAECNTLYQTFALWSQVCAVIILNEKLLCKRIFYLLISIAGVMLIIRPPFLFENESEDARDVSTMTRVMAGSASVFGSIIFATGSTLIKKIGSRIPTDTVVQYYHFQTVIVGALVIVATGMDDINIYYHLPSLFFLSIFTYLAHLFSLRAYSLVSLAILAPFTFSSIFYALFWDFALFSTVPSFLSCLGGLLIIFSILLNVFL